MVWSLTWSQTSWSVKSSGHHYNKASGGDRISAELFQILKDDAVKVLHSICQQIWKTQQWPQDWKKSVSFQSQRKAMPKNAQTTTQLHSSYILWRVRHDWVTSLSLFPFMHWRKKWQPTPVFLPGESQEDSGSLVGCCLWGHTESDMTEAT